MVLKTRWITVAMTMIIFCGISMGLVVFMIFIYFHVGFLRLYAKLHSKCLVGGFLMVVFYGIVYGPLWLNMWLNMYLTMVNNQQ